MTYRGDYRPQARVIAWYAHHQGAGQVTRATTVAPLMTTDVVISSGLRPAVWPADRWVQIPDDGAPGGTDPTTDGVLHWAPLDHPAYRMERMERIARWVRVNRSTLVVSDVSVEVALLVRLLGVPVVVTVMAGDRSDRPHVTAYDAATALVAGLARRGGRQHRHGVDEPVGREGQLRRRLLAVRRPDDPRTTGRRRVTVLWGPGG